MSNPDYAAELAHARFLAQDALDDIDTMIISETLPDELYSEDAVERIAKLLGTFTADPTAQTERAYLANGETR